MKITGYLADKLPAYIAAAAAWAFSLTVMYVFGMPAEAMIIITVIVVICAAGITLWDYLRRKVYFDKMCRDLDALDQKYLLSEMMPDALFYEGRIYNDVLRQTNKSMCDNVAYYRREALSFREYIEMWVHETKLPVASLQLMCHNDGNTKYAEQLRRIDDSIESVLYYARSENAEKDYIIKPVLLKRAVADIAVKNRTDLQEHGISLSTEGLDKQVMTDSKWLSFMIGQLMANSIKYGADEISITAEDGSDCTVLHFRDNGIGIPESDMPYIFEKSFTGENGRKGRRSTGMGLYIVKRLCDKLGHSVTADSVQGEYTDIIITFGKNDIHDVL
ncbi:MAG: sensor histidine kinase [Oscillospiraceae bacterium]|nr:sensor histidine kinase [Oscillospiraceae bacterium]